MAREVIWQFLKITLLGVLAVLLVVRIQQADAVERRWLDVRDALGRQDERLRAVADRVEALAREMERGIRVVPGTDVTGAGGGEVDPRTLPYWPTEDNILVPLDREPRPPADAPRGGIIRYYTGANIRSLNEYAANDAELQERICGPVYEYLAVRSRHDPDDWIPGLCNRVTVNEDFTEFTCHVRKGQYWHAPHLAPEERRGRLAWLAELPRQEVTAADVKFTFDVVMDPESECGPQRSYLVDVESVDVIDRYTVRVRWRKSLYYNKSSTLDLLMIYPKFIYERGVDGELLAPALIASTFPQHWFNDKMCGTGPFQFAGYEPNQIIRLRRNDEWWWEKPAVDGVDLRIVQEPTTRLAMFKAGELDLIDLPFPDYRAEILEGGPGSLRERIDRGEVTLKKWEMFTYYFVGWNFRHRALREKPVRHALAHLYPTERIRRDILFGLATPHDGPVHHWVNAYATDLPKYPFDPGRAAAILEEAGWTLNARGVREKVVDGERVELRIKMLYPVESSTARDRFLLYQKAAAEAGVLLESNQREWTVMTKMLDDKDFDAAMLGWGMTWDSDPSQIWHSDSARAAKGSNFVSYINPELDQVIEGLKAEFDPERRKQLWHRFQHIIAEDQPYRFTFIVTRAWVISNRLGNHFFNRIRPQDWLLPWTVKNPR